MLSRKRAKKFPRELVFPLTEHESGFDFSST
jgi:hypothetical protein